MALESNFARGGWIGVALLLLAVAYSKIFVPAAIAKFRQDLFGLRRELFLVMADGGIAPTDPVYVRLRTTMNGLLRFAERVSLLRMLVTVAFMQGSAHEQQPTLKDLIADVQDPAVGARLQGIQDQLGIVLAAHLALASPVGWLLACVVLLVLLLMMIKRGLSLMALSLRLGRRLEPLAEVLSLSSDDDRGGPVTAC